MRDEELDRECVERCRGGDIEAFGELVDRYQRPIFNTVYHMVRNQEDAADICQQVFLKAIENLATYRGEHKVFSWIYRIAINESLNRIRSRRDLVVLDERLPSLLDDPETAYQTDESSRAIRRAVMALKPEYRAVIILRHFSGCSYQEAAEILQINEKTVKWRLFTARQILRDALEADGFRGSQHDERAIRRIDPA
jgi:RNA polymerase sigma-70 factor, ECF subfamily